MDHADVAAHEFAESALGLPACKLAQEFSIFCRQMSPPPVVCAENGGLPEEKEKI
jgi:hypothetical protein